MADPEAAGSMMTWLIETPENDGYRDQRGFAYMHHCLSASMRAHPPAHASMDMPVHVL